MNPSVTIPTTPLEHPAMDYAFLRAEGIRLLESLSGQLWTDFNAHDPGITILEQLCYAITDLGYRINYDIKDLLTSGEENPYRSLYSPAKVLTTNPVTLIDLRKLVIDVVGVKNAWIEPVEKPDPGLVYDPSEKSLYLETSQPQPPHREPVPLRGLYRVLIETDENLSLLSDNILLMVNQRLHACRSLGEDFLPPVFLQRLPKQGIIVNAKIEIGAVEDPQRLLAEIYHTLANAISPRIRFHTLTEMLNQGKNIDEILDGPALEHGFIDNADLERFQRKTGLRTSDLLQEIMDVDGVTAVSNISISAGSSKAEDWYLKLDPGSAPFFAVDESLFNAKDKLPTIRLTRGGIEVQVEATRVKKIITELEEAASNEPLPESERDIQLAPGRDRKVTEYHSIQHQFPALYGIGAMGLPESASPERKAQSKQLKAYLMFFDQLLANYFAQLGNAKELFSFYAEQPRTYFSQTIQDATLGLDEILINQAEHAAEVQAMTENRPANTDPNATDELASPSGRKNRFLNHLLARFAEQFTDYSLLQYAHLGQDDLIDDKSAFLQDYHEIGAGRGTGFDYTLPTWNSENVSGLEKRISRKLGISTYRKQDLAGLNPKAEDKLGQNVEGGFHVLEHILLRPRLADREQWAQTTNGISWQSAFIALPKSKDPYSHQLSFIFPDWIERFKRPGFRDLITKTLREETPAHIRIYIHWLDQPQMLAFESAQKQWLGMVIAGQLWNPISIQPDDIPGLLTQLRLRDARDRMVQILGLGIPYPLRDVKLKHDLIIAYNHTAAIQLLGAQAGVLYQLCDEDGNIIIEDKKGFEVSLQAGQTDDQVFLNTPAIQKDITFTILAVRETKEARLEAYLNQVVSMQAGIDTKLPVSFQTADGKIASEPQLITNYGDQVTVIVANTQEGISYKLSTGPKETAINLSEPKIGNKKDISLISTPKGGFTEDTPINVLAYRTVNDQISALLDTTLTIMVRPNPALTINIEKSIVDYKTDTTLTLVAPQSSVEYRLFKRDVTLAEYLPDGTAGSLIVKTDEGRSISVKTPEKVTDWNAPTGFVPLDVFKNNNGSLSVSTGKLLEDTLFIVQATKIANREQLPLDQSLVILVRPNTASAVSVAKAVVDAGTTGMVRVSGTQKGVAYQLRLDNKAKTPVNPPGYHQTDRGLETERLEVDLVLDDQGKPMLLLPTGTIKKATTFNVLAIKTITGVSAQLNDTATIDIPAPADSGTSSG